MDSPATSIDDTTALFAGGFAPAPKAAAGVSPNALQPERDLQIDAMRKRVHRAFIIGGWLVTGFVAFLTWSFGTQGWWVIVLSGVLNLIVARLVKERFMHHWRRIGVALIIAFQPLFLLIAMRLTGFDALTPLAPFVGLMVLAAYCDRLALLGAAALVFGWFLCLETIAPNWLFVGDDVWRNMLYTIELGIVAGFAALIAESFERLVSALEASRHKIAERADMMHKQAGDLEQALHRLELERDRREQAEAEQEANRKAEIARIVQHFEETISVVGHSISETANILERTITSLRLLASDTGESASNVAISAEAASTAARNVAQGVAELSASITTIASTVTQHNDLTATAATRSVSGGEAVGSLARQADKAGEATRAIVRIAERTNLLSLNAAIEASSAGPAGRGFTIVAQEVKALAYQASEAATEIDAFLKRIHAGTHEAKRSFEAIDSSISELTEAAGTIRWDVERQRNSADTIENYASAAASDVGSMAQRSRALASTASTAEKLAEELSSVSAAMLGNVIKLEEFSAQFVAALKSGQLAPDDPVSALRIERPSPPSPALRRRITTPAE